MIGLSFALPLFLYFRERQLEDKNDLNWDSTYAIALELRRQHPEVNIEEVSLQQIYQWTIQLNEFEDDLALVNDDILYAIYQDWYRGEHSWTMKN